MNMSLLATFITVLASSISAIPRPVDSSIYEGVSLFDSIYVSRWEQAAEHNVTSNVFVPSCSVSGGVVLNSDCYEANDNYDDATLICPSNISTVSEYKASVDASLNFIAEIKDIDFYVLPLLSDSHVTVSSTSDNSNFSLKIVGDTYTGVSNGIAVQEHSTIFFDDTNFFSKHCSFNLKAGTYYLIFENLCDQRFDYSFDVSVSKIERCTELDITEARHYKHADAALWISDLAYQYLPHYLYAGGDVILSKGGMNGSSNHRNAAFETVESLIGDDPFVLSELLIWDNDVIDNLVSAINTIRVGLSTVKEKYSNNDEINLSYEQFHSSFDKATGIISCIIGFIDNPYLELTIEVANGVVDIVDSILPLFFPPTPRSLTYYISYLNSLASYLSFLGDHVGGVIEKPARIPCFVSIIEEDLTTVKLDYSYNACFYDSANFTNFDDYSVSSQIYEIEPSRRGYCSGTFYYIKEDEESLTIGTKDSLENYITVKQLSDVYGLSVSVLPQYCDDWFSYTSKTAGIHSFVLDSLENELGQMELYEDTFIYPQSQTPLDIATYTYDGNLCLSANLEVGKTVYIRVCGTNNETYSGGSLSVYEGSLSPLVHLYHDYTYSYVDSTVNSHKAFCECGAMTLMPHVQSKTWTSGRVVYSKCGLCGGVHSGGKSFMELNN